mgnify:CR=1 FL=1
MFINNLKATTATARVVAPVATSIGRSTVKFSRNEAKIAREEYANQSAILKADFAKTKAVMAECSTSFASAFSDEPTVVELG